MSVLIAVSISPVEILRNTDEEQCSNGDLLAERETEFRQLNNRHDQNSDIHEKVREHCAEEKPGIPDSTSSVRYAFIPVGLDRHATEYHHKRPYDYPDGDESHHH